MALGDPRAESPPETRLRVCLVAAGLPPVVQHLITDEHGFPLARADLTYPDAKLAVEYDGSDHFGRVHAERERFRDAELASHGWETVRTTANDLGTGSVQTIRRVAALLALRAPGWYARLELDVDAVIALIKPKADGRAVSLK